MQKSVYELISKNNGDPIVERRTCARTGEEFAIFQSDIDMLKRISPTIGGNIFTYPLPTLSPEARLQRRMMFRNERKLYRRKCDLSGASIISVYSPEYKGKVVSPDIWRWDSRDGLSAGKDITDGKFLEQFKSMLLDVPMLNLFATKNVNSEYVNGAQENKNCYMIFASDYNENSYYSYSIKKCMNTLDCYGCTSCTNVYNCIDCVNATNTYFSQRISDSYNIFFSTDLKNCQNCLLSFWLKDKQYFYKNEFVGKEKRESEILPLCKQSIADQTTIQSMLEQMKPYMKDVIVRNMNISNSENAYGDLIVDSKSALYAFELINGENIRDIVNCSDGCKDILGWYVVVDGSQKIHEGVSVIANYSTATVRNSWHNVKNTYFGIFLTNVQNGLGCIGLKNGENIILNKQYSATERETKAQKIIQELQEQGKRWEFLDPEISPFPYNDTVAYEYYPLHKMIANGVETILNPDWKWTVTVLNPDQFMSDAIIDLGGEHKIKTTWRTKDNEPSIPADIKTLKADEIPSDITKVSDDILNQIIICETSGRPFRITRQELDFYRKHGLPLPHKHSDARHEERVKMRPGRNLHCRTCDNCGIEMVSIYPDTTPQKVYCDDCYTKEIYG